MLVIYKDVYGNTRRHKLVALDWQTVVRFLASLGVSDVVVLNGECDVVYRSALNT